MARHHEDLEKTFTDEQKDIFEYAFRSRWRCNRIQTNNISGIGEISDADFLTRILANESKCLDLFTLL